MPSSTFSSSSFLSLLYFLCMTVYSLPADSPFGLLDPSEVDSSSFEIDPTNLGFWDEGELQSQSNDFTIASADIIPAGIDPNSYDLFNPSTTLSGENDPFLAYTDIDSGITQDDFDVSGASCGPGEQSFNFLTFGDLWVDEEHECLSGQTAACCGLNSLEIVQGARKLRNACFWWRMFGKPMEISCQYKFLFCCRSVGPGAAGVDCDPKYQKEQLQEVLGPPGEPSSFCKQQIRN